MKRAISSAILVGIVFGILVSPAAATPPEPVTITIDQHLTGPNTAAGTWTASGAIFDSGDYAETFRLRPSGAIQGTKTLTSLKGTITLRAVGVLEFTGPTTAVIEGRWVVLSGAGDYAHLHGHGPLTVHVDFATGTALAIHEGVVHLSRGGRGG
jgi:hypothetical protein